MLGPPAGGRYLPPRRPVSVGSAFVAEPQEDPEVGAAGGHRPHLVALLTDAGDDGARELGVQIRPQLGVIAGGDQLREVRVAEVPGDVDAVGAAAEHVVGVAQGFVRPAHVLGEETADHDVVADHGLRRHVTDVGVREPGAVLLEPQDVGHVVLLRVFRVHLVHDDHEHTCWALPPGPSRPGPGTGSETQLR